MEEQEPGYALPKLKLNRTMSDAFNDQLYIPSFRYTLPTTLIMPQPRSAVLPRILEVANKQHLRAPCSEDQGRDEKIAFRKGSPFATITQMAENDDRILQQQMQRMSPVQTAPKTISPRDALLETVEESAMPLFPPQKSPYGMQTHTGREQDMDAASQQSYGSMATSRRESTSAYSTSSHTAQQVNGFTFAPSSVPGGIRVPQQYPFVQQRRQPSNLTDRSPEFPSTLSSMESSSSEYKPDPNLKKPTASYSDAGTYTCTYHDCTLRFETPAKLQKHKREGHSQSAPLAGASSTVPVASQAGPHKCTRISPQTGKPCNVIFSRPYDLTRHEDTIHNTRKIKTRCPLCKEEKTFSRSDALTRHLKVVHPEYTVPTKSKRGQQ